MKAAPIYLDYAATTPIDDRVVECMMRSLKENYGNPASASHQYGQEAAIAVDQAREHVAKLFNADPDEIIFTSGATESINTAIKGIADFHQRKGRHIVTLATEHKAVLEPIAFLTSRGASVTILTPLSSGLVDLQQLEKAITNETVLVSIAQVNHELGVIQDIAAIAEIVKAKNSYLHVDAAQSVGKLPIDVKKIPIDLLSCSAHKFYGPKGVGALYVRSAPRVRFSPLLHGGGQERGLRSGTLAVHQIVGMGEAARLAHHQLEQDAKHAAQLRDYFIEALHGENRIRYHTAFANTLPNIVNLSVEGVEGEALRQHLFARVACSTGAACSTLRLEPSYVLRAIGVSVALAQTSLRFSFGRYTTETEIKRAAQILKEAIIAVVG